MRLINVKTGKLEEFHDNIPPYAILSHTWGPDYEEISFRDAQEGNTSKPGFGKVKFDGCCRQAQEDGLDYAWIDTCCIDKTNAVELGEAINSMFRWYQTANVCYAILADVSEETGPVFQVQFRASRWFERGWTLQELVAPRELVFYNNKWQSLGSKRQLAGVIAGITGIPRPYLLGIAKLQDASVAQRMSWAASRATKRKEDVAYSLMGIFGVMIPMIYGEGDMAFIRLQEEIMRKTPDDSILAWDLSLSSHNSKPQNESKHIIGNVLAPSPANFAASGMVVSGAGLVPTIEATGVSRGYLHARLTLHTTEGGQTFGLLNCRSKDNGNAVVGIPLSCVVPGDDSDEFMRPAGSKAIMVAGSDPAATPRPVRIHESLRYEEAPNYNRRYGFYIEEPASSELDIIDVHPQERWENKTSFVFTGVDFSKDSVQRTWIKVRHTPSFFKDFVVSLELEVKESKPQARCHVMIASRDTTLEHIDTIQQSEEAMKHLLSQRNAHNRSFGLQTTLTEERLGADLIFVVKLAKTTELRLVTIDADAEMELLQYSLRLQKMFEKDQHARPKLGDFSETTKRKSAEIAHIREMIQKVERELREKEEEKQQLSRRLKTEMEDLDRVTRDYAHFRNINEDIDKMATNSRVLPGAFGEDRLSAWRDWMLDHLERALPGGGLSVASIPDIKKRVFMKTVASGNLTAMAFIHGHFNGIDFEDDVGHGILCTAVHSGYLSTVRWVIENMKLDIDHLDGYGTAALHQAAGEGLTEIARFLLEHGASADLQDQEGWTSLHLAARAEADVEMIRLLLDGGAKVQTRTKSKSTPLAIAAIEGHAPVVELLLEKGALIQATEADGATPLYVAAEWGRVEVARLLLRHGADIEAKTKLEMTALHAAAEGGHTEMVALLLDNGADMKARDVDGFTPLLTASANGRCDSIGLLLDRGAFIEAQSAKGETPLHLAAGCGHTGAFQTLVDRGADIEAADAKTATPLMAATWNGRDDITALLLQRGAVVDARDGKGHTALFHAIECEHKSGAIGLLLGHGADMNVRDRASRTVLHAAVARGHIDAVRQLIERGVDVSLKDGNGETALQHARGCAQTVTDHEKGVMLEIIGMLEAVATRKRLSRRRSSLGYGHRRSSSVGTQ